MQRHVEAALALDPDEQVVDSGDVDGDRSGRSLDRRT
jgi:hypothetical protein